MSKLSICTRPILDDTTKDDDFNDITPMTSTTNSKLKSLLNHPSHSTCHSTSSSMKSLLNHHPSPHSMKSSFSDSFAYLLQFDHSQNLIRQDRVYRSQYGTTVKVSELFKNFPVRFKELERNIKREFSKCMNMIQSYALASEGITFHCVNMTAVATTNTTNNTTNSITTTTTNTTNFTTTTTNTTNKNNTLSSEIGSFMYSQSTPSTTREPSTTPSFNLSQQPQQPPQQQHYSQQPQQESILHSISITSSQKLLITHGKSMKDNIVNIFSLKEFRKLVEFHVEQVEPHAIQVNGYISRQDASCGRSSSDRQFLYINKRRYTFEIVA